MVARNSAATDREKYDQDYGERTRARQVAGDLAEHLLPGPVLDAGAGTGLVALELRELGYQVTAVDSSEDMIAAARQRLGADAVLADASALPVPAGSVTNLVCVHLLHLIDDLPGTLAEAARVTAPGGRLIAIHGVPAADPDDMITATEPLRQLMDRMPDAPKVLDLAAAAAGFRLLTRHWAAPLEGSMSPNVYAQSIADKVWAYLAYADGQTWDDVVVPVIAALRALPEPDRRRPQSWRSRLAVYERA
ncbi:MAG TPA: class I SAM-dependent methyltransferase [Streptosporangiaceae bacterium]